MRPHCVDFPTRILRLATVLHMACWLSLPTIHADEGSQPDADRAIKSIGQQTWYDRQADGYAPPRVRDSVDNPLRTQGWIAEKSNEKKIQQAKNAQAGKGGSNWNFGFQNLDPTLFSSLMIAVLAIALVSVIVLLTYHSLRNYMPNRWEANNKKKSIEIDPAKVSDLPFDVQQATHENPLAEAEALMRAGDYSRAIIFLYGYMLLALDQSRAIELQRGKTNRMYLSELKRQLELRELVETTMLAFEEVYFGKHPLTREQFLASWNQLDKFHELATGTVSAGSRPAVAEVVPT